MENVATKFRTWVLAQRIGDTPVKQIDENHFKIDKHTMVAEVNIYPMDEKDGNLEIAEYRIIRVIDGESVFFLHVLLDDLERAKELFEEMADELVVASEHVAKHILLCCTSALTTSLLASKMGDVAVALSLDYDFTALPISVALEKGGDWAAVLLAPQVSQYRRQIMEVHPDAIVFEIPGKVFGSYDAPAAVQLVMHALRDLQTPTTSHGSDLRAARDLANDRVILIITLFYMRDYSRLGYRVFDHGVVTSEGSVRKTHLDFRDIEDLLETLPARGIALSSIDGLGIALPGIAYRGTASFPSSIRGNTYDAPYDLRTTIEGRFGIKTYVDNNCNAAAVGCYVSQDKYENLMFYRHAFGHEAGGLGTIMDGKLVKGHGNIAGETKFFERLFSYDRQFEDAVWNEDGILDLTRNVVAASIVMNSPEAVYLSVDTLDTPEDMEDLHNKLCETIPEAYIPPLYIVNDYIECVYLGEMAISLQKLRDPSYRSIGIS